MVKIKLQEERGKSLAEGREDHYYIRKYKNLTVADLLLVLEDDNWHNAETLVECIAHQNYSGMIEICKIILAHEEAGQMSEDFFEKVRAIDAINRGEE